MSAANRIITEDMAISMSEEAIKTFDVIADKLPNVRDFDKNPERLLNMQGENADVIGALFKNSIGEAEYVCRNSRAIIRCAGEISRMDRKVGLAFAIGGAALMLGGYLWTRVEQHERRVGNLERRVAALEQQTN